MLDDIITNKALVATIWAWALAQLSKTLVAFLQGKGLSLRYLYGSGGMPSSHSALVSALATAVAIIQGFGSVAFAICFVMALIVMYDAAGVRQSVSRQSRVLNRIVRELSLGHLAGLENDLRELVGHTPFQVFAGSAIGIAVALLWVTIAGA
ncbi:MAG: divergent PAP2 family protein [Chloroflexota bacterium]